MLSNESLHSPVFNRSISETSMDNSSMEDFWCELKNIKENSDDVLDDSLVMDVKPVNGKWRGGSEYGQQNILLTVIYKWILKIMNAYYKNI